MTKNDDETIARYPLQWPAGWKRTPSHMRRASQFKSGGSGIGHRDALARLEEEMDRLGAKNATLSTNLELKFDGTPRASDRTPSDPGVALYFRFKGRATVFACDSFVTVPGNVAAIAAHIKALRAIERYGVGSIEQALAGYKALPADTAADWRAVFGFKPDARVSKREVEDAFRRQARDKHPDRGGSDEAMSHLNRAREFALAELT